MGNFVTKESAEKFTKESVEKGISERHVRSCSEVSPGLHRELSRNLHNAHAMEPRDAPLKSDGVLLASREPLYGVYK